MVDHVLDGKQFATLGAHRLRALAGYEAGAIGGRRDRRIGWGAGFPMRRPSCHAFVPDQCVGLDFPRAHQLLEPFFDQPDRSVVLGQRNTNSWLAFGDMSSWFSSARLGWQETCQTGSRNGKNKLQKRPMAPFHKRFHEETGLVPSVADLPRQVGSSWGAEIQFFRFVGAAISGRAGRRLTRASMVTADAAWRSASSMRANSP